MKSNVGEEISSKFQMPGFWPTSTSPKSLLSVIIQSYKQQRYTEINFRKTNSLNSFQKRQLLSNEEPIRTSSVLAYFCIRCVS